MSYKDYFQRMLENQVIYKGSSERYASVPAPANHKNLGDVFVDTFRGDEVWGSMSQMSMDPDAYKTGMEEAEAAGPLVNREIEKINSQFMQLYWQTEKMVTRYPQFRSKLRAFGIAQNRLYAEWMRVLKGFSVVVDDLEVIMFKFNNLLSQLLRFNAAVKEGV